MPLSQPAAREALHQRDIRLRGFRRADGLFDVEAELTDTKTYGFGSDDRTWIAPGEPLHGMQARMTVDDALCITAFEASMDYTPFRICPDIAPNFARLAGLRIGPGFLKRAAERVGGTQGCTHLRELLQQMATVAYQTLAPTRMQADTDQVAATGKPPAILNTCHAYAADSPVVRRRFPALSSPAPSGPAS